MRSYSACVRYLLVGLTAMIAIGCVQNRQARTERPPMASEQGGWFRKFSVLTSNTNRLASFDDPSQWPARPSDEVVQSRFAEMFPNLSRRTGKKPEPSSAGILVAGQDSAFENQLPDAPEELLGSPLPEVEPGTQIASGEAPPSPPETYVESANSETRPASSGLLVSDITALSVNSAGVVAVAGVLTAYAESAGPSAESANSESTETTASVRPPSSVQTGTIQASVAPSPSTSPATPVPSESSLAKSVDRTDRADVQSAASTASTDIQLPGIPAENVAENAPIPNPATTKADSDRTVPSSAIVASPKDSSTVGSSSTPMPAPVVQANTLIAAIEAAEEKSSISREAQPSATTQPAIATESPEIPKEPGTQGIPAFVHSAVTSLPDRANDDYRALQGQAIGAETTAATAQPSVNTDAAGTPVAPSADNAVAESPLAIPPVTAGTESLTASEPVSAPAEASIIVPGVPDKVTADEAAAPIASSANSEAVRQPEILPDASGESKAPEIPGIPVLASSDKTFDSQVVEKSNATRTLQPELSTKPTLAESSHSEASPGMEAAAGYVNSESPVRMPSASANAAADSPGTISEPPPPAPAPELRIPGISESVPATDAQVEPVSPPSPTDAGIERSSGHDELVRSPNPQAQPQTSAKPLDDPSQPVNEGNVPANSVEFPDANDSIPVLQPLPDEESVENSGMQGSGIERKPGEIVIRLRLTNPLRMTRFRSPAIDDATEETSASSLKSRAQSLFAWYRDRKESAQEISGESNPDKTAAETPNPAEFARNSVSEGRANPDAPAELGHVSAVSSATGANTAQENVDKSVLEPSVSLAQTQTAVSRVSVSEETRNPISGPDLAGSSDSASSNDADPARIEARAARTHGGLPPVEFPASYRVSRPRSANPWYAHAKPAVNLVADPRREARVTRPAAPVEGRRNQAALNQKSDVSVFRTSLDVMSSPNDAAVQAESPKASGNEISERWWSKRGGRIRSMLFGEEEIVPPKRPNWAIGQQRLR